jgi:hypothetical protein
MDLPWPNRLVMRQRCGNMGVVERIDNMVLSVCCRRSSKRQISATTLCCHPVVIPYDNTRGSLEGPGVVRAVVSECVLATKWVERQRYPAYRISAHPQARPAWPGGGRTPNIFRPESQSEESITDPNTGVHGGRNQPYLP